MLYSSNGPQYNSKMFSPPVQYKGLSGRPSSLNSVLQVLFMTKDFREAVERHTRVNPDTDHIDRQLKTLFDDLRSKIAYTYEITRKLGIDNVWREVDAAEVFEKILDVTSREASQIFRGRMMRMCSACRREADTDQEFCQLPFELLDVHSEQHSVDNNTANITSHAAEETSGEKQIPFRKCGARYDATIEHLVKDYPEVLMLRLKKYEYTYVKRTLQISENQKYELYAFVDNSARGGYYTATIKSQDDDLWYNFDDCRVKRLDQQPFQEEDFMKSDRAYLLFYRKKEDDVGGSTPTGLPPALNDECVINMEGSEMAEGATEVGVDTSIGDKQKQGRIKDIGGKHHPLKEGAEMRDALGIKDGKSEEPSEKGRCEREGERKRDDGGDVEKQQQYVEDQNSGGRLDDPKQTKGEVTREQGANRDRKGQSFKQGSSKATKVKYKGLSGGPSSLNSVLQVLFMTKDFREAVGRHNPNADRIDRQLKELFDKLTREIEGSTLNIRKKLGINNVCQQRDAAEYIEKILRLTSKEASQIFHGLLTRTTRCSSCGDQTHTEGAFWNLPLPPPPPANPKKQPYSVVNGIKDFFRAPEKPTSCSKCRAKCVSECFLPHHPEVLTLMLKQLVSVNVPRSLQIPENQTYELYAFVEHYGDPKARLYTATIRSQDDDMWYNFNESRVTQLDQQPFQEEDFVKSRNAYLLFYKKKEGNMGVSAPVGLPPAVSEESTQREGGAKMGGSEAAEEESEDKWEVTGNKKKKKGQNPGTSERQQQSGQGVKNQSGGGFNGREQKKSDEQTKEKKTNGKGKGWNFKFWEKKSEAPVQYPTVQYHGLINQGATCYLNSVLQVLFMTKDFREAVGRYNNRNRRADCIDPELKTLFNDLDKRTAHTNGITRKLCIDRVWEQRDAAEYIEKILSLTSKEASQIFHGMLTRTTRCLTCGDQTDSDGEFWNLPLPLKANPNSGSQLYSVLNGIEEFFKPLHFNGENRMFCSECDAKSDATIECTMKNHPEVLMLLLKRFELDYRYMRYVKNNRSVEVPSTLHIPGVSPHQTQTYELYAVVEHSGDLYGGHYTAIIKSQDNDMWYDFNDSWVTQLNVQPFTFIESNRAYLLFYRKKEDDMGGSTPAGRGSEMTEAGAEVGDDTAVADKQRDGNIKNMGGKHHPVKEKEQISDAQEVNDGKTEERSKKGGRERESEKKRDDEEDVEKGRRSKDSPDRQQQQQQGVENQNSGGRLDVGEQQKSDEQTREQETDRKPRDPVQYKGLSGATRSLNSVLQVLFMTKDFGEAVERHTRDNPDTDHIDRQLKTLFDDLRSKIAYTYETARTNDITRKLGIDSVREQRDAAEYIEKILRLTSKEASQIFHGTLTRTTRCLRCGDETDSDEAFWKLPLPLKAYSHSDSQLYSVLNSIEEFFKDSQFSGENQMFCSKCDAKRDATTKCAMKDPPEVLTLLLKRFELNSRSVEVPFTLQITENQKYELYAFVDHFGLYTATVKSQDNDMWYDFTDIHVTPRLFQPFQVDPCETSRDVYLLFYRKTAVHTADNRDMSSEGVHPLASPDISELGGNIVKIDSVEAEGAHAQSKDHSEGGQHSGQGAEGGGSDDSGLEISGLNICADQIKKDGGERPAEEEQQRNEDTEHPPSSPAPTGLTADHKEGSSPEGVPPVISDVHDPGQDGVKKTESEEEVDSNATASLLNQNNGGGLEVQAGGGQLIEPVEASVEQDGETGADVRSEEGRVSVHPATNPEQQVNEGLDSGSDKVSGEQQGPLKMSEGSDGADQAGRGGAVEGGAGIGGRKDSDGKDDLGFFTNDNNERVGDCTQDKPFPENRATGSVDGMSQEDPHSEERYTTVSAKTSVVELWRTPRGIEERTEIIEQEIRQGGSKIRKEPDEKTNILTVVLRNLSVNDRPAPEKHPTKRASDEPNTTGSLDNPSRKMLKLTTVQEAAGGDEHENMT